MNADDRGEFKLTVAHVKSRLLNILEHRLSYLTASQNKQKNQVLLLNEALLQEWNELLFGMLYFKQQKQIPSKAVKIRGQARNQHFVEKMKCPPPKENSLATPSFLLDVMPDQIDIFQIQNQQKTKSETSFKKSSLEFNKGLVHGFSSCTCLDHENVILIGGCRENDCNLKSHDIMKVNLTTKEVVKVGHLPYGVSSHGAELIGDKIYVVGGNKNYSIVSKKCLEIDINSYEVKKIADLNYPSASHSLLNWHSTFLYKFGGIGSCFGEWDLSPYIERYEASLDIWEIINPIINIDQDLLHHYSLMVNSLVYVSNRQSIVILGGFDFCQQGSNKMFQIEVQEQKDEEEGIEYVHTIIGIGQAPSLQAGGFPCQQKAYIESTLFALQGIEDQHEGLISQVVTIQ